MTTLKRLMVSFSVVPCSSSIPFGDLGNEIAWSLFCLHMEASGLCQTTVLKC